MKKWTARSLGVGLVVTIVAAAGCTRPYGNPVISPDSASFVGIRSQSDEQAVDIVSMHGMCTHDREWVDEIAAQLATGLDLTVSSQSGPVPIDRVELFETSFADASGATALRNYSIVWSGYTTDLKASLCYDTSEATKVCQNPVYDRRRAPINGLLKSKLMNDCFADALIYVGARGPEIREGIRRALHEIRTQRQASPETPLFLIAESLGSKVLADAIMEAVDARSPDAGLLVETLASLQQIYMGANQIALLELADSSAAVSPLATLPSIERLRGAIATAPGRAADDETLQIVAFTDPNDMLSYELPASVDGVDVIVSNKPTILWLFESPWGAHTGYLDNPSFWEVVLCGFGDDASC
jgi:hypothetical protein